MIILRLLDEQVGDQLRLEDMLDRCKSGKELYKSDTSYLQRLSPKDTENPIVFTEEEFVYKETPKIKNKRTSVIVLTIVLIVIAVAAAILVSLIVFTNLIYFHGIPQEGFCDESTSQFCVDRPYFQDFLQIHFEHIYDRIIELFN
jgi:hypothetical protein